VRGRADGAHAQQQRQPTQGHVQAVLAWQVQHVLAWQVQHVLAWQVQHEQARAHARLLRLLEVDVDGDCPWAEEEALAAGLQAAAGRAPEALLQKRGQLRATTMATPAATRVTPCKAFVQRAAAAATGSPWTGARVVRLPLAAVKVASPLHGFLAHVLGTSLAALLRNLFLTVDDSDSPAPGLTAALASLTDLRSVQLAPMRYNPRTRLHPFQFAVPAFLDRVAPAFARLSSLTELAMLGGVRIGASDVARLAAAPRLVRLAVLAHYNTSDDEGMLDAAWHNPCTPEALDLTPLTQLTHLALAHMSGQHKLPPALCELHVVNSYDLAPSMLELPSLCMLVLRDVTVILRRHRPATLMSLLRSGDVAVNLARLSSSLREVHF
jgi:hypothetical protein